MLAFPVILAMTFGALRVNSEGRAADELNTASDEARIIAPVIAFGVATENLATASATGQQIEVAITEFDKASRALVDTSRTTTVVPAAVAEINVATGTATAMRDEIQRGRPAPSALAERTDAVLTRLPSIVVHATNRLTEHRTSDAVQPLVDVLSARRSLAVQRILLAPQLVDPEPMTPNTRATVLAATGSETASIDQLARTSAKPARIAALRSGVQTRRDANARPESGVAPNVVADSTNQSVAAYTELTTTYADALNSDVRALTTAAQSNALRDAALTLAAVLAALALAVLFARTLIGPIRRLRTSALAVAHQYLPQEVAEIRAGGEPTRKVSLATRSEEEIGQLANAVDDIHEQAVKLAGEQARLRIQIGAMFETLSRRSKSLVDQQLNLIEALEVDEDDPRRLDSLFRLDHLAARMRRNCENLLVLAGTSARRTRQAAVPAGDVARAAVSGVEDYQRVEFDITSDTAVAGAAVADIVHLLTELIDNALRYSPPDTAVRVFVGRAVDGGLLIEVADQGLGMAEDELAAANDWIAAGGEVTPETARQMGLFVVGRLAQRHRMQVHLRVTDPFAESPGVSAAVHIPSSLLESVTREELTRPPTRTVVGQRMSDVRVLTPETVAAAAPAEPVRHLSLLSTPRPEPEPERPAALAASAVEDLQTTPIFQNMVSEWFSEAPAPQPPKQPEPAAQTGGWGASADAGWAAAERAEQPADKRTPAGLPQRTRGARLVPGGIPAPAAGDRNPDVVRSNLLSHIEGVRRGRAHSTNPEENP